MLTAKAMGASKIIITDVMENRLEAAKAMGATHVYKVCMFKSFFLCPLNAQKAKPN